MKDYYDILGISKEANPDEIKRAYRKLAHQYHPDKAGKENEAKFKEINEAYQVLSDPQKRATYDQFGSADFNGAGGFNGSYDDLFRQFGGGQGGGFGFGGAFGNIFDDLFGATLAQMQVQVEVRLTQALLGDELHFEVNGQPIKLVLPAGTQEGDTFRFPGKGGVYRGGRGDLLVSVRVKYPKRLNNEQKRLLEELKRTGI